MKSAALVTGGVLFLVSGLSAGPWVIDANAKLTTALNSYSDSWEGGEAGSFTWGSQFLGTAERQLSPKLNTKTTLNLQFGQTKIQNKTSKEWDAPEKSSDLIDAAELLRLTLGAWVDPFVSVRAISQFLDGSDPLMVRYVNPIDLTEAAGVSRTLKKNDNIDWSTRIGAAARQYIDRQKLDALSYTRSTDMTNDGGVEFNMDLKAMNAAKWATLISSLKIYEALISSKADEFKAEGRENVWRHPHVKWENTLTLTFAKYLMLGLTAYAYYDKDINTSVRLKETFSAGLTYMYAKK
jgi:hypothetical protein